eukprot:21362-Rhodomonas_salina.1
MESRHHDFLRHGERFQYMVAGMYICTCLLVLSSAFEYLLDVVAVFSLWSVRGCCPSGQPDFQLVGLGLGTRG